jgi:hypothetical protein
MQSIDALVELAGDRVLAPADAHRVLAHIDANAPGIARMIDVLPY